jgi:hypothetical protein
LFDYRQKRLTMQLAQNGCGYFQVPYEYRHLTVPRFFSFACVTAWCLKRGFLSGMSAETLDFNQHKIKGRFQENFAQE